jgi:uncharacterized protein (DUF2141 family)
MRRASLLSVAGALVLLSACSNLGALGNILGALGGLGGQQQQSQIEVEIRQVDVNAQRIHVRTRSGETGSVRFDSQTQVIYRQQSYPVTALEPGDIAVMQVQQTQGNELYASRIDVTRSAQER